MPTASPSQLADPDSELGRAAAAVGRLYYVDLVPRASRNSHDSPESGQYHRQPRADMCQRCSMRAWRVNEQFAINTQHWFRSAQSAATVRSLNCVADALLPITCVSGMASDGHVQS